MPILLKTWDRGTIRSIGHADQNWSKHRGRFVINSFSWHFLRMSTMSINFKPLSRTSGKKCSVYLLVVSFDQLTIEQWPYLLTTYYLSEITKLDRKFSQIHLTIKVRNLHSTRDILVWAASGQKLDQHFTRNCNEINF